MENVEPMQSPPGGGPAPRQAQMTQGDRLWLKYGAFAAASLLVIALLVGLLAGALVDDLGEIAGPVEMVAIVLALGLRIPMEAAASFMGFGGSASFSLVWPPLTLLFVFALVFWARRAERDRADEAGDVAWKLAARSSVVFAAPVALLGGIAALLGTKDAEAAMFSGGVNVSVLGAIVIPALFAFAAAMGVQVWRAREALFTQHTRPWIEPAALLGGIGAVFYVAWLGIVLVFGVVALLTGFDSPGQLVLVMLTVAPPQVAVLMPASLIGIPWTVAASGGYGASASLLSVSGWVWLATLAMVLAVVVGAAMWSLSRPRTPDLPWNAGMRAGVLAVIAVVVSNYLVSGSGDGGALGLSGIAGNVGIALLPAMAATFAVVVAAAIAGAAIAPWLVQHQMPDRLPARLSTRVTVDPTWAVNQSDD